MPRRKKNISRWFNRRRTRSSLSKLVQRRRAKKQNKGRVPSTFGINPSLDISKAINPVNFPKVPKNDLGLKSNLPQVSLSDRPQNLNEVEEQKDIVTKLEEGTNDAETKNILDRGIDLTINVIDAVSVNVPDIRSINYPKVVRGADFVGYDVDFKISWDSLYATYVKLFIGNSTDFVKLSPKGTESFNIKDLIERYNFEIFDEGDKVKIPLRLVPVNEDGKDVVEGLTESIPILFDKGDLNIPRTVAINRFAEGFISQFSNCEFDESNYLTHLLHLGDGDNKVITTWVGSEDSLILKLYEPLPANVRTNQKVWITKIQSNPIIETISLTGDGVDYCPPLQGPNFSLEVDNGIGYQVYDDLLASGSTTNTSLVQKYISKTGIDTEKLNIEYTTGSNYYFENFVHFGSSEERIKNFWYKVQLLETYQSKYTELTTTDIELGYILAEGAGQDGYVIITENSDNLQLNGTIVTATTTIEANKQLDNINNLIGSFDGFENFLYTSTDDLAYPKSGNSIVASTTSEAIAWYNAAVNEASTFDRNNVDYMNNNLPEFIKEDYQNEDFLLFMDMLGHHFDVIWAYINGLNKLKKPQHKADLGFSNDLVYTMLESLGWEGKKEYDSQFLWEYALGQYKDGTQKYQQSLKSANEEVWRRILNNLPYLLKHKGTARSLKAVMACYGVPQSLLTIMEFGGPTDPTDGGTQPFTFDDRTAELVLSGNDSSYIQIPFNDIDDYSARGIEFRVSSTIPKDTSLIKMMDPSGTEAEWEFKISQTTGSFANLDLYVSSSSELHSASIDNVRFFDGEYKQILINKSEDGTDDTFDVYLRDSINGRIRTEKASDTLSISNANWTGSGLGIGRSLRVGNGFNGSLDEFRLWKTPLETNLLDTHTLQPDSIAGNSYTASAEDLVLRFDFELPKDLSSSTTINNVAISTEYNVDGTAVGFDSISDYPYHYRSYERTITAKVHSLGFNQADKIRFESQTLVGDLSHKVRATKKSLDRAPIDSSRLGLFFSPIKELNMDIIKSFGNFNIDNYIGAPADEYKDEYTELKSLRDYYFQRLNRDIYEYIRLIRYIDKSLFDVLEDLVPARAKVSKGLLIEPHFLERSKTKWDKPTSEKRDYETIVDVDEDVNLIGDNNQFQANIDGESDVNLSHQYDNYDANIDGEDDIVLTSTNPQYDSSIDIDEDTNLFGTYPTYISEIKVPDGSKLDASAESFGFEQIGMDPNSLNNAGFGLFTPIEKYGEVSTLDIFGNLSGSRQKVYLIKESYIEKVPTQVAGYPATTNNEQVRYEDVEVTKFRYKVTKVPFGAPDPSIGNDVVEVTPLKGYIPSHYRYKNNLSQGLN